MASPTDQKKKFETEFQKLVDANFSEATKKWDGHYYWYDLPGNVPSQAKVDAIVNSFPPVSQDKYQTLLRTLKSSTL
jgi:hypothetical protein